MKGMLLTKSLQGFNLEIGAVIDWFSYAVESHVTAGAPNRIFKNK